MSTIRPRRAVAGAVLTLGLVAGPIAAQASDPLKAGPECVNITTNKTVKPCPIRSVSTKPAKVHRNKTFTVRFRLREAGDWSIGYSTLGNGGQMDGHSMGTAKKAGIVSAKVKDSHKGGQRLVILLTPKSGKAVRYSRYLDVLK